MKPLHITLCAIDPKMATAWQPYFNNEIHVEIVEGDILQYRADALVSPANSFGFMDGGIDLLYAEYLGWDIEKQLQAEIHKRPLGEVLIGEAVIIPTQNTDFPYLISAPTMRTPTRIPDTINVYLAFRAALLVTQQFNQTASKPITSLLCPALGAGIGSMPYEKVARQMHSAYQEIVGGDIEWRKGASKILNRHAYLMQE